MMIPRRPQEHGKRRLFVALPIGAALQEEIIRWEVRYAKLPVRWLMGKNLHITLLAPWYADDVEEIKGLLETVAGAAPFDLSFRRVTYGPDPSQPRLIWAEGETPAAPVSLRDRIAAVLGVVPEQRPYRLHLTLARFREESFLTFPIRELDERVNWRDTVRSFVLMESRLARSGADYRVLAEIPLA